MASEIGAMTKDDYYLRSVQHSFSELLKESPYCIHPSYLKYQLDKSLSKMKLTTLDTLILSNPLFMLGQELDRKEVGYRIMKAFEFLEEMVIQNKIRSYGISGQDELFKVLSITLCWFRI